jgi:hypothetical protein
LPPPDGVSVAAGDKSNKRPAFKAIARRNQQAYEMGGFVGLSFASRMHIGRRPIASFGNSDGGQAMLEWTTSGSDPRFGLLVTTPMLYANGLMTETPPLVSSTPRTPLLQNGAGPSST